MGSKNPGVITPRNCSPSVRQAIQQLSTKIMGLESTPTFAGLTLSDLTQGSVVFAGASGVISQDNSNLFWDSTNNRLGIGINTGFFPAAGMTVSGEMDLIHTSSEADDHAFELDVDAAGYGDVKAIDIDYITGDISKGKDEAIILVNIDEIAATGGDVFGLEILATEGAAGSTTKVYGLKAGALVGPIHQDSGTFLNPGIGTNDTPQTPVADMIDGDSSNTTSIFVAFDDYIIIGKATVFEEIEFILTTDSSGAGIKPKFEYSTGGSGFTEFFPVDGTNGFRNTGVIAWDAGDLTGHAVNTGTGLTNTYDIKITRKRNTLTTPPVLGYAKTAATTEYIWDEGGNVSIKTLTVSTIAAESSDVDKFLVDSSGIIKYRTGTQVLSDIGGQASGAILDDLNTLGAPTSDGQFIVATGAGAFAYESTTTARTSLGVGTGDSPAFANVSLGTGELTTGSINRASGTLTLEIGGTAELSITSTTTTFGGNIVLADDATIGHVTSPYFTFDNTTNVINVTGSLNIGPSPGAGPLMVSSHFASGSQIRLYNTVDTANNRNWMFILNNAVYGDFHLMQSSAQDAIPDTFRLSVGFDGNIGIGVSVPDTKLEVFHAGDQLKLSFDATDNATFAVDTAGVLTITPSGAAVNFASKNLTSVGAVGCGTITTTGNIIMPDSGTIGQAAGPLLTFDDNNNFLEITGCKVGIGESAPSQALDLIGSLELEDTTTSITGVIYKGASQFIHNFRHPTGNTAVPVGQNTFVGVNAGNFTIGSTATATHHGSYISAVGYGSLLNNTEGFSNSAVGWGSLLNNTTGHSNNAVGYSTLTTNTTGYANSAVGASALRYNTTGYSNNAMGNSALLNNTTGYYNSAMGHASLLANTEGYGNNAMGVNSLRTNTTGHENNAIGFDSLYYNTEGYWNTAIGFSALYTNTTGHDNNAIGANALYSNTTGYENNAIGSYALYLNTTGRTNSAMGANSLRTNTTGYANNAMGFSTLYSNTTGRENNATGSSALYSNTEGNENTAIGVASGYGLTTGSGNIFIGYDCGRNQTTNSNLLIIDNQDRNSAANEITTSLIYGIFAAASTDQSLRVNAYLKVKEAITGIERSSDPTEPVEGEYVIWMSNGSGKGDDGDVMIASNPDGTTKYGTLLNYSDGAAW